jgi:hypothetical protein
MATFFYYNLEHFKSTAGYNINDKWYPRVTSIVAIKAKPALYRYYGDQESFEIAQQKTSQSATEGSLIHNTIEAILKGEKPEIPLQIKPSISAFLSFLEKNKINPLRIEEKIKSEKHWYAGTLDLLAEINGILSIIDIKTSVSIFRDYNIQTAAYQQALYEEGYSGLGRFILRVDQFHRCLRCSAKLRIKGGNEKIRGGEKFCSHIWGPLTGEVELKKLTDFEEDLKAFLACKQLWQWENQFWLKQIKEGNERK